MSTEGAVIEIVKWIRESIRPVVVLLIVSSLGLFLPHSLLTNIGIGDWLLRFRPWTILIFTGSLIWLGTFPIEHAYQTLKKKQRLQNLASDEQDALRPYVLNNVTVYSFSWWRHGGIIAHMEKLGILFDTHAPDGHQNPHVRIDLWTYSYLRKHPELVGIPKNSN